MKTTTIENILIVAGIGLVIFSMVGLGFLGYEIFVTEQELYESCVNSCEYNGDTYAYHYGDLCNGGCYCIVQTAGRFDIFHRPYEINSTYGVAHWDGRSSLDWEGFWKCHV